MADRYDEPRRPQDPEQAREQARERLNAMGLYPRKPFRFPAELQDMPIGEALARMPRARAQPAARRVALPPGGATDGER